MTQSRLVCVAEKSKEKYIRVARLPFEEAKMLVENGGYVFIPKSKYKRLLKDNEERIYCTPGVGRKHYKQRLYNNRSTGRGRKKIYTTVEIEVTKPSTFKAMRRSIWQTVKTHILLPLYSSFKVRDIEYDKNPDILVQPASIELLKKTHVQKGHSNREAFANKIFKEEQNLSIDTYRKQNGLREYRTKNK